MLGVRTMPCGKHTLIDYEDYVRMGVESHTSRVPVPPWAMNDEKVRRVVSYRIAITARARTVPTTLNELRELEPLYIAALRKSERSVEVQQHIEMLQHCGGPIVFYTTLIYRRFRLAMNSTTLARQYRMTPTAIRQQINRISRIARTLFPNPEDHLSWHHTATVRDLPTLKIIKRKIGGVKARRIGPHINPTHKFDWKKARELRQAGQRVTAIAKHFGVTNDSVDYALRRMENYPHELA